MSRPKLVITHVPPHYWVHYRALEDFLAKTYRLDMCVLKSAGVTHGVFPEYRVGGILPPQLQARADRVRQGHRAQLALILEVLCVDKHLPAGDYVLDTRRLTPPLEAYKRLLREHLDPLHSECVQFKKKHRNDPHFHKLVRVIDRSLLEWLKKERP